MVQGKKLQHSLDACAAKVFSNYWYLHWFAYGMFCLVVGVASRVLVVTRLFLYCKVGLLL